ncbi:MAG: hypothetical protein M1299_08395 [Firmicutes bacterium]|nr:hypothetical protein [Bacillota bacterium]MCL5039823.1 hypothetical protein [Bacillota bacterium]
MSEIKKKILDALDVETFFVCENEEEARGLALGLMAEMGFSQADVVFLETKGPGARVRVRTYVHRPGNRYGWL